MPCLQAARWNGARNSDRKQALGSELMLAVSSKGEKENDCAHVGCSCVGLIMQIQMWLVVS